MIDTEVLRKKVIDLAIQGRLTEQLPSDGDAETLYAQIHEEKDRLVKEGKIKKERTYGDITEDEIPFEIPNNWKWVRIGQAFTLQAGKNKVSADIHSEQNDEFKYPCYGGNGLRGYVDEANVSGKHVLIGRQGALCGNINLADNEFWATEHAVVVYQYGGTDVDCYAYMFKALNLNQYATSVAQPGLAVGNIERVLIPLPPIAEQKRLVARINSINEQIDIIDDLQAKYSNDLAVLKSKIIDAGIQGKLTEQFPEDGDAKDLYAQIMDQKSQLIKEGKIKKEKPLPDIDADEIPFEIPKNWKWVRIASVGLTVTGTTPPKENKEYYDGKYPFFKPFDLDAGRHISVGSESLTNEGWKVSRQLRKGSILVCCIGTIGKSAIIDVDGTTNQQINAIMPILCDSDYLLYAIESDSFQKQLQQGSRATTVTIIKKSRFDECLIPLPALSEQKRIAERINELLSLMELIEE